LIILKLSYFDQVFNISYEKEHNHFPDHRDNNIRTGTLSGIQKRACFRSFSLSYFNQLCLDISGCSGSFNKFCFKSFSMADHTGIVSQSKFLAGISSFDDRFYDKLYPSGQGRRSCKTGCFTKKGYLMSACCLYFFRYCLQL